MKKELIINITVILGVIVFNILFWKEGLGVNTIIFSFLITLGLYIREKDVFKNRTMQIITLGTFGFAIMVIMNNSLYSKVLYMLSSILMIGIAQERSIRFLGYGLLLGGWSMIETPMKMWSNLPGVKKFNFNKFWMRIKLFFIPAVIFLMFLIIYSIANAEFLSLWMESVDHLFYYLFKIDFSWDRFLFSVLGLIIFGGVLWKSQLGFSFDHKKYEINREKRPDSYFKDFILTPSMIALKNEYKIALITVVSLNLLLLFVNMTDFQYVWMKDVEGMSVAELRRNVHQGTYILTFSIIMAMAVVIYFMRRNLNFIPNNQGLKIASYIWIVQNAFLGLSVGMRNIKYIQEYGIAYKRIGVFIFLFLTFIGLLTMIIKVNKKKSVFYLIQRNAWVWYSVFWMTAWVNWDVQITKYNLHSDYDGALDVDFIMYHVSDKNLYLLEENIDIIKDRSSAVSSRDIQQLLDIKKQDFLNRKEKQTWLSWNKIDDENYRFIKNDLK